MMSLIDNDELEACRVEFRQSGSIVEGLVRCYCAAIRSSHE